ncbi:phosphomannomutase 2 [Cimex lectularius]|uniref:Phosphomannomutase n=1 Tax=Cimex lectularius TaxID=79782 RepID=A0A8I6TCJ0_CIMLE|nr:phosphomannomutase 2 [Cimex lectularius]
MGRENAICLFDVDGTLTKPRQVIEDDILNFVVEKLKNQFTIGLVGGSDYSKILEQMGGEKGVKHFDYIFSENGVVARKDGKIINESSIAKHVGEDKIQALINFCLRYLSNVTLPLKRGTFIEYRTGLINVSPVGRSCSQKEREEFYLYDQEHHIRDQFKKELEKEFSDYDLKFSIGGQISLDVFPVGWDKTYCLQFLEQFDTIYFFGDKTQEGGNDFEIFNDQRVVGHSVTGPNHTLKLLEDLLKQSH